MSKSLTQAAYILIAAVCAALSACSSPYQLQMSASKDPIDESVLSPQMNKKNYTHVMVLPPSGTQRGQWGYQIDLFEREFLKNGMTVVSSAVTGRVVLESDDKSKEKRVEGASQLSDAERALVMAKQTGADAILQIGNWSWSEEQAPARFFLCDRVKKTCTEVSESDFRRDNRPEKLWYTAQHLMFTGRLMDVESGQVVASFKMQSFSSYYLPHDYHAQIEFDDGMPKTVKEDFEYSKNTSSKEAIENAESRIIEKTAQLMSGQK